jgi:hypothetical protein
MRLLLCISWGTKGNVSVFSQRVRESVVVFCQSVNIALYFQRVKELLLCTVRL